MKGPRAAGRIPAGPALPLLVLVAVTIATRAPYLGDPAATFDEQLYDLIGRKMLDGFVPYVDLWDRKPIGLFLIFAFAAGLGNLAGLGEVLGYQLLALLFTLAGAWLTWKLAARDGNPSAALAAGAAYPVLMAFYGSQSGQSEAFYMPLMLAMLALVEVGARKTMPAKALLPFCAAMLAGGMALQVKYSVAPQCAFMGIGALWQLRRKGMTLGGLGSTALAFGALGLLPTILAGLAYALTGHWGEFLFANFLSILDRTAPQQRFAMQLLPYLAMLAALGTSGILALVLRRERPSSAYLLRVGWTASCAAGLFMGSTIYAYYLAALVPGVLLMAMPLLSRQGPVPLVLLVAALLLVYDIPGRIELSQANRTAFSRLTAMAAPHVDAGGRCLFVSDGPSALYRSTGSCMPSRFVYPDHLNNALEAGALGVDPAAEVRRILARRPGAIVTADHPVTVPNRQTEALIHEALARDYRPVGRIAFDGRVLTVHACTCKVL